LLQLIIILGDSNAKGIEKFTSEFMYLDCTTPDKFQTSLDSLHYFNPRSIYFSTFFNLFRADDIQKDHVEQFVGKVEQVCRDFPYATITVQLPYYQESYYFTIAEGLQVNLLFLFNYNN
jgi:hypothetical protein